MSYCVDKGKDKVLFISKSDDKPSEYEFGKYSQSQLDIDDEADGAGLVLPSGAINWNCPCLGGLAVGPCSVEFREAFSCFHNSKEELKGSECVEKFQKMHDCMASFPELYSNFTELPSDDGDAAEPIENSQESSVAGESIINAEISSKSNDTHKV